MLMMCWYFESGDLISCLVTAWNGTDTGNTIKAVVMEITLRHGWNALSLPFEPLTPDPAKTFPAGDGLPLYSGDLVRWVAFENRYAVVEELKAGVAFWLYLPGESDVSLLVNGTIVEASAVEMPTGWSFLDSVGLHLYRNLYDSQ